MSAAEERAKTAAAVAELGALPVPIGPGPLKPEADGITRRIAPTQALLEDPHDSPLHHDYRVGRDLPEPGGAS